MAEESFRTYRTPTETGTNNESDPDSENGDFYDLDLTLANPSVPRNRLESTHIDPSSGNIEGGQQQVPVVQNPPPPPPTGRQSNVSVNVEPVIEILNPVPPNPRTRSTGPVQIISYGGYIPPPCLVDERTKRVKSAKQLLDERKSEKRTTDARRAEDRERVLSTE